MDISHEAIYQALYIQGRGALKRELVSYLRMGRALRVPRARAQAKAWAHVSEEVMISSRPANAEDRAVPGHWEGDLIIGLDRSAIGTLVERSSRGDSPMSAKRKHVAFGTLLTCDACNSPRTDDDVYPRPAKLVSEVRFQHPSNTKQVQPVRASVLILYLLADEGQ